MIGGVTTHQVQVHQVHLLQVAQVVNGFLGIIVVGIAVSKVALMEVMEAT
jgi:hypothetical protein